MESTNEVVLLVPFRLLVEKPRWIRAHLTEKTIFRCSRRGRKKKQLDSLSRDALCLLSTFSSHRKKNQLGLLQSRKDSSSKTFISPDIARIFSEPPRRYRPPAQVWSLTITFSSSLPSLGYFLGSLRVPTKLSPLSSHQRIVKFSTTLVGACRST